MINFVCKTCDYNTSNRKDFNKHVETNKHKCNKYNKNTTNKSSDHIMVCICGKSYNHRASLYNHKKKCVALMEYNKKVETVIGNGGVEKSLNDDMGENIIIGDKINITTEMFMKLVNDNQDMIKIIKEQQQQINMIIPKIGNITTNNMTTNMTNNNFNLNIFLNEKCKDALNISDFIRSLKITLDDLMYTKNKGLVEGITNVMIKGLRQLDIYKRPIHCTDTKRETMYIKDCEKWEKDDNHDKIKNTILKIANKERNMISVWVDENPDWFDTEASQIEYLTMVRNVCEPIENDERCGKKIIRNISREVFLDKMNQKLV